MIERQLRGEFRSLPTWMGGSRVRQSISIDDLVIGMPAKWSWGGSGVLVSVPS